MRVDPNYLKLYSHKTSFMNPHAFINVIFFVHHEDKMVQNTSAASALSSSCTLNFPKFLILHVNVASLPIATDMLSILVVNSGTEPENERKKKTN